MAKTKYVRLWEYYQPNPRGNDAKNCGDCTIRAVSKVTGLSWAETLEALYKIAMRVYDVPMSIEVVGGYLEEHGFERKSIKVVKGGSRPTVYSFTREHPTGTYVLRVAHHVVAVENGKFYDTWNSGDKSIYLYYEKKDV